MVGTFVYSVLASLLIAVHSTMALPSDIQFRMTDPEKLLIFGTEDPDPEYGVFPMSLSGMTILRDTNQTIQCKINVKGEEMNLNFKPTPQYLATKYMPVWSAISDPLAYKHINYQPLTTAMDDIGEFTMYHDVENEASLIIYKDRFEHVVIEGFISSRYAIKSLPKRWLGELLKEVDDIIDKPDMMGGPIASNKDAGFYVVIINPEEPMSESQDLSFEIDDSIESTERKSDEESKGHEQETTALPTVRFSVPSTSTKHYAKDFEEFLRKKRNVHETLFPEMLIVLDHSALRHRTMTQALRFTLAFWNAADLIYRRFDDPKIHLNIAGVIIAADNTATPYIAKNVSVAGIGDLDEVSSKMGKYFFKDKIRFPHNQYDIIIAMTTMNLCEGKIDSCGSSESLHGYANGLSVCSSDTRKTLNNIMILHNDGLFGPEYSFFAQHEKYDNDMCSDDDCRNKLHPIFLLASNETKCLLNKPLSSNLVNDVLPGRWLSMDGQCQNEGYAGACNHARKSGKCLSKGCRDKRTRECVRSEISPLLGSTCATTKYCNRDKKCVYNF